MYVHTYLRPACHEFPGQFHVLEHSLQLPCEGWAALWREKKPPEKKNVYMEGILFLMYVFRTMQRVLQKDGLHKASVW